MAVSSFGGRALGLGSGSHPADFERAGFLGAGVTGESTGQTRPHIIDGGFGRFDFKAPAIEWGDHNERIADAHDGADMLAQVALNDNARDRRADDSLFDAARVLREAQAGEIDAGGGDASLNGVVLGEGS